MVVVPACPPESVTVTPAIAAPAGRLTLPLMRCRLTVATKSAVWSEATPVKVALGRSNV